MKIRHIILILLAIICVVILYLYLTKSTIVRWDSIYEFAHLFNEG